MKEHDCRYEQLEDDDKSIVDAIISFLSEKKVSDAKKILCITRDEIDYVAKIN